VASFFLMFSKRKNAFELFIDDEKQIQNKTNKQRRNTTRYKQKHEMIKIEKIIIRQNQRHHNRICHHRWILMYLKKKRKS